MYNDINYLYLKDHAVFQGLTKDQLYDILGHVKFARKRKSELIRISENEQPILYFLIKGKVKVTEIDEMGNSLIKGVEREGDIFGNFARTSIQNYEFAQTLTNEVVFFYISLADFESLSKSMPLLALNLSDYIGRKLKNVQTRYNHLVFKDVKTRLVSFFMSWADSEGHHDGNKITIKNYLTHSDIAEIISTCRQTVTSILNDLKSDGYIDYSRREIVISDMDALERAA